MLHTPHLTELWNLEKNKNTLILQINNVIKRAKLIVLFIKCPIGLSKI